MPSISLLDVSVQELESGRADLSGPEAILEELGASRGHWTDQGIDDYTLTVQVDCICPPEFRAPFTVRVEGGEIVEATL
jgi:hypothetical protein